MKIYVGSDPGKLGHIAWLTEGGTPLGSAPQPVIGLGKGDTLDRQGMIRLVKRIREQGSIALWAIELQWPVGGGGKMNPMSISQQMKGYGLWLGILSALEVPYVEITPQLWRKKNGVVKPSPAKLDKLPSGASKAEKKEHAKKKRQLVDKARKETLLNAIRAAQQLFPSVDFRLSERNEVPSADKAAAFLIARSAYMGVRQDEEVEPEEPARPAKKSKKTAVVAPVAPC